MSSYIIDNTKTPKYGVTEKKKETLDLLSNQILDAQNEVQQLQAIVQSLTEKSNKLTVALNSAEQNKEQALQNKELGEAVVAGVKELEELSEAAYNQVFIADEQAKETASQTKVLIDKLIYTVEVINKLSNLVIRKKAINPLISNELVDMVTKAGSDANNAVALTLKALEAVFASQATILESKGTLSIEREQVIKLYAYLTGKNPNNVSISKSDTNVQRLLDVAYDLSKVMYNNALIASNDTTDELNELQGQLNKASIYMKSLESGYSAAKAAALAS